MRIRCASDTVASTTVAPIVTGFIWLPPARKRQELSLIPLAHLGERHVVARVKDGAVLEDLFRHHQCLGPARWPSPLLPAHGQWEPKHRDGERSPIGPQRLNDPAE